MYKYLEVFNGPQMVCGIICGPIYGSFEGRDDLRACAGLSCHLQSKQAQTKIAFF